MLVMLMLRLLEWRSGVLSQTPKPQILRRQSQCTIVLVLEEVCSSPSSTERRRSLAWFLLEFVLSSTQP